MSVGKQSNLSIKKKLIGAILAVGLIPVLIVGLLSVYEVNQGLTQAEYNKLKALREVKKKQITILFQTLQNDLHFLSKSDNVHILLKDLAEYRGIKEVAPQGNFPFQDSLYEKTVKKEAWYFDEYIEHSKNYDVFLIDAKTGQVEFTQARESDLGENLATGKLKESGLAQAWHRVVQEKKTVFIDYKHYEPSGEAAAFMAEPVYEGEKLRAVIAVQVSTERVNEIMRESEDERELVGLGESCETYLVGEDLLMRSDSYLDKTGNHSVKGSFANPATGMVKTDATAAIFKGETGEKLVIDYNGNPVFSAYAPIDVMGVKWGILAEIDEWEGLATADYISRIIYISVGILVAVLLILAFGLTKSITRPINGAVKLIKSVVDTKDFSKRLVQKESLKTEMGLLAHSFNNLLENVSEIIGTTKEMTGEVAAGTEQTSQMSSRLAATAEELSAQAETVTATTDDVVQKVSGVRERTSIMSGNAEQASGNVNDIAQNIESISESVQNSQQRISDLAAASTQLSSTVNEISENTANARTVTAQAVESVGNVQQEMQNLDTASLEISSVVQLITEIAEQTKLLALNATIEAARAGDAGKGFAVVASEVKALALQTAQATHSISESIESIQGASRHSVSQMGDVSDVIQKVNEIVTVIAAAVEEQNVTTQENAESIAFAASDMENVISGINDVNQSVAGISNEVQQVATGSEEIARDITIVADNMGEIQMNLRGTNEAAADTSEIAQELNVSAEGMSSRATHLKEQVDVYTV